MNNVNKNRTYNREITEKVDVKIKGIRDICPKGYSKDLLMNCLKYFSDNQILLKVSLCTGAVNLGYMISYSDEVYVLSLSKNDIIVHKNMIVAIEIDTSLYSRLGKSLGRVQEDFPFRNYCEYLV